MNIERYFSILETLPKNVRLVAVSKGKSIEDINALYEQGQQIFGENRVQEITKKYELLPKEIKWHFVGHLQSNKVKYIAPFIDLIHAVDSFSLLKEINKQALKITESFLVCSSFILPKKIPNTVLIIKVVKRCFKILRLRHLKILKFKVLWAWGRLQKTLPKLIKNFKP